MWYALTIKKAFRKMMIEKEENDAKSFVLPKGNI